MDDRLIILQGDALAQLKTLPDESVHCCVTSPPYWGLRDYGTAQWEGGSPECDHSKDRSTGISSSGLEGGKGTTNHQHEASFRDICKKCGAKRIDQQLGLERTPEEYLAKMVAVFREVKRVLREDGILWLNIGDSYAGGGNYRGINSLDTLSTKQASNRGAQGLSRELGSAGKEYGIAPKNLVGIPWRLAFALQADGWYLRSDIIWHKPNPMPESVTDRPTKSHEYIFLLSKSADYFYDAEAVKEQAETSPHNSGYVNGKEYAIGPMDRGGHSQREDPDRVWAKDGTRNKRTVWTVPEDEWQQFLEWKRRHSGDKKDIWTVPSFAYPGSHFATFPPDLIKPCILAGTSARGCCAKCGATWERLVGIDRHATRPGNNSKFGTQETDIRCRGSETSGLLKRVICETTTTGWRPTCQCNAETVPCTVLDPFFGSGTTGMVALELGRKCIGIELNPEYIELARGRCNVTIGFNF